MGICLTTARSTWADLTSEQGAGCTYVAARADGREELPMIADETCFHRACVVMVMSMVLRTSERLHSADAGGMYASVRAWTRLSEQGARHHIVIWSPPQSHRLSCAHFGFPLLLGRETFSTWPSFRLDDPWRQSLVTSTNVTSAVRARQCGLNSPNEARRRATVIGSFAAHPLGGGFEGEVNVIVVGGTTSVKALRLPPFRGLMTTLVP